MILLLRYTRSLLFQICYADMMTDFNYSPKIHDERERTLAKLGIAYQGCNFLNLVKSDSLFFNSQLANQFSYSDPTLQPLHQSFEEYVFSLLHQMPASIHVDCLIMMSLDSLFVEFLRLHYPEKISPIDLAQINSVQSDTSAPSNPNKYHN